MRWMRSMALAALVVAAAPAAAFEGLRDVQVVKVADDEAGAFCAGFLLSNRAAALSLQQSNRITQEQYLQQFDFLPCYVQGTARLGSDRVQWEMRAGGNGTITKADGEVVYLGCDDCARAFGAH